MFQNETLITVSLMDVQLSDIAADGASSHILGLTSERTFVSTVTSSPRTCSLSGIQSSPAYPLVKLRFASSTDASSGSKEARIKATLYGFTYTLSSDFSWVLDLAAFVKNPPGVRVSVLSFTLLLTSC